MNSASETFGNYTLSERIAVGGMAEVFLGQVHGEAGFTKQVVIKRLHQRYCEDDSFIQMFIDEARLTSQLNHSNICQVLDLGSVDGAYFMAMEFIAGEDLRTIQDHCKRADIALPVEAAVAIISEVLAGMDYAHAKRDADNEPIKIIHRDISPQNILVSYSGEVKIIDFGIAKAKTRMVKTEAGIIKGKYRYMSPEQASGKKIDHRTDIFAAGVVLYELLLGEPHSVDLNDTELLHRMRRAALPPIRKVRPHVPQDLEKIVAKAMKRKRGARFSTAEGFRQALLRFLHSRKVSFGRKKLSAMMDKIFDEQRQRQRSGSWPPLQAQAKALPEEEVVELDLEEMVEMPQEQAQDEEAQDEEPTTALPASHVNMDEAATRVMPQPSREQHPQAAPQPTPAPQPQAEPATDEEPTTALPVGRVSPDEAATRVVPKPSSAGHSPAPKQRRGRSRNVQAGRFSLANHEQHLPPKPRRSTLQMAAQGSVQNDRARQEQTSVTRGPPSNTLRTVVGTLLVLIFGGGLALGLVVWNPPVMNTQEGGATSHGAQGLDKQTPLPTPDAAARPSSRRRHRTGRLHIQSKPTGARIVLCNKARGRVTPSVIRLPAGKSCDLALSKKGFETYTLPVKVLAGKTVTIKATLRRRAPRQSDPTGTRPPLPARAAPRRGTLKVTSIEAGTVFVNNKQVGKTPRLQLQLKPGAYYVKVAFPAQETQGPIRYVAIEAGRTTTVHFEPTD